MQLTVEPIESVEIEPATASRPAEVTPRPEVLGIVMAVLAKKNPTATIDHTTGIFSHGLADSQMFLDIILEVEDQTGLVFDHSVFDFEETITAMTMARAFRAA